MFGEEIRGKVRVCCGPRCGSEPGHGRIFDAIERSLSPKPVLPVLCQGLCHCGVTVVCGDGRKLKVKTATEAEAIAASLAG